MKTNPSRFTWPSSHKTFPSPRGEKNTIIIIALFSKGWGSGALQLAGNDKYLHAGPREGQATAALLSRRDPAETKRQPRSGSVRKTSRAPVCLLKKATFKQLVPGWALIRSVLLEDTTKVRLKNPLIKQKSGHVTWTASVDMNTFSGPELRSQLIKRLAGVAPHFTSTWKSAFTHVCWVGRAKAHKILLCPISAGVR